MKTQKTAAAIRCAVLFCLRLCFSMRGSSTAELSSVRHPRADCPLFRTNIFIIAYSRKKCTAPCFITAEPEAQSDPRHRLSQYDIFLKFKMKGFLCLQLLLLQADPVRAKERIWHSGQTRTYSYTYLHESDLSKLILIPPFRSRAVPPAYTASASLTEEPAVPSVRSRSSSSRYSDRLFSRSFLSALRYLVNSLFILFFISDTPFLLFRFESFP